MNRWCSNTAAPKSSDGTIPSTAAGRQKTFVVDRPVDWVKGDWVVITTTDATGHFVLKDLPVVPNLPIVFQIGKWRRQITIPMVTQCADNPLNDPNLTRLPKTQSEGDMPKIALTSGSADPLGCILPKLGIAASEFTATTGMGKVNTFNGNIAGPAYATSAQTTFWNDANTLRRK